MNTITDKLQAAKSTGNSTPGAEAPPSEQEREFQTYKSSRESTKVCMGATVLAFKNFQYITASEAEIAHLDEQIELGIPGISKGEPVKSSDLDPMVAMRRKIIKEYLEDEAAQLEANAPRDMGSTEVKPVQPASTESVAAGDSNSKTSK